MERPVNISRAGFVMLRGGNVVRLLCALLALGVLPLAALAADSLAKPDFDRDIRPIFAAHCLKCHGEEKQQGGVRLDHREFSLRPGDSGSPPIVPGKPVASELIRRLEASDASERMPANADPLSPEQIELLKAWVSSGAVWSEAKAAATGEVRREMIVTADDRQHWSYRPFAQVELPAVKDAELLSNTIDRFVVAAQEAKNLASNPPANPAVLIRRLSFDLLGLPPSPEEVATFVADPSPVAYESLVDRLLASPHYGERWGRHWLDLARYADSDGLETDRDRPTAFHYRDFVIRALNADLSYQTFTRWQLAGDEYEPDNPLALAATGFLTGAPCENLMVPMEEEKLRLRYNELDDMAVTTMSAFLGLTLGCARCHDHKFDAIPTRDYYRIQCAFTTTSRADVLLAPRDEAARYRALEAEWSSRLKVAQGKLKEWLTTEQKPHTTTLRNKKIDALTISDEDKLILKEQPDSDAGKKLASQLQKVLVINDKDYRELFTEEQRHLWDELQSEVSAIERVKPPSPPQALAITDTKSEPEPTWLLERGDFYAKKSAVELGFLSVFSNRLPEEYRVSARAKNSSSASTLQRRALADWLTDVEHGAGPLLTRVIVNRIWQHHFGEGLVRTAGDFGVRGERPTHPELLEWLCNELISHDWQLKSLHRLLVTSSTYRQSTAFDDQRAAIDPDNRLLWRRRPQRLEAEILRDAILAVSGTLNAEPFGPAFKPPISSDAIVARNTKSPYPKDARDTPATRRRSVYMFHKRVTQNPLLQVFDEPDASVSCARRNTTTVAPQALALLNDTFVRDRAIDCSRRLLADANNNPNDTIDRAFWLALSRTPRDAERNAAVQFVNQQFQARSERESSAPQNEIRQQAIADLCQALFSLNEFIYVD